MTGLMYELYDAHKSGDVSSVTTDVPTKYEFTLQKPRNSIYIYDTLPDQAETRTDQRPPVELDVKKRAITLE
jgi:hypothetical protein